MPSICEIEFENNPQKVVYAGQLLRGRVCLTMTEEQLVRGIYIRIYGIAYCLWSKGSGNSQETYSGSELYLDEKTYFVGDDNGEIRLKPGTFFYSFQCLLPADLPTSVEGDIGHIRYTAHVVVDIPKRFDREIDVHFTVIKAFNLNDVPALREPTLVETQETFCRCFLFRCCFTSGPLKIAARIPVGGYVPGQIINLEINVDNQSDQVVNEFEIKLLKQITYFTNANSIHKELEKVVIMQQTTRGCSVNQTESIRVNIEVPPIPPTDCSTSNIVKVNYLIRVIGSVTGCHVQPILELPVTIGSYPLLDSIICPTVPSEVIVTQPTVPQLSDSPREDNLDAPHLVTGPSLPFSPDDPPTYAEAMHLDDPSGNNFRPKYAIFKRTTSYSSGD